MMEKYLERWKRLDEVYIPPIGEESEPAEVAESVDVPEIVEEAEHDDVPEPVDIPEPESGADTLVVPPDQTTAYLIRKRTNERIDIDKEGFVIGKGSTADYQVEGNPAISRNHVKLTSGEGACLVEDMGSLNHTYIDGERVEGSAVAEAGQMIKLADEIFELYFE